MSLARLNQMLHALQHVSKTCLFGIKMSFLRNPISRIIISKQKLKENRELNDFDTFIYFR